VPATVSVCDGTGAGQADDNAAGIGEEARDTDGLADPRRRARQSPQLGDARIGVMDVMAPSASGGRNRLGVLTSS